MATVTTTAATMRRVGGDPTLDFVNTVGGRASGEVRADKLAAFADLVAWSRKGGLIGEAEGRALLDLAARRPREAGRLLSRARRLREALYAVLDALRDGRRPRTADLGVVNEELAAARRHDRLVPVRNGLQWRSEEAGGGLEAVLRPICHAASSLLTSSGLSRLRQCGGTDCGWLFLDLSRNHSRQWCTMDDCGNVSKVRRFRQRRRRRAGSPGKEGG
jgi:predicted RNA-binding Zn ribbon-like protein